MLPRVFAPDLTDTAADATLRDDEARHLVRVRRLRDGDRVRLFDGAGREWEGRLTSAGRDRVVVTIEGRVEAIAEPRLPVTVAVGLLKGDQMDLVVRDATMLGAAAIVPIASARVTVPDRARRAAPIERWQRIAVASAKQCGRAVVPPVRSVASFAAVLAEADGAVFIATEPGLRSVASDPEPPLAPASALVLIGPEGGWSAEEVQQAIDRGATVIQLGPRTIRAETAPTVVLASLWTWWGW